MARHRPASSKANGTCSPQGGDGVPRLTYCKQDEVLLVVLANTVIDPGTVVVHFPNAPLADAERAARQTLRGGPHRGRRAKGTQNPRSTPLLPSSAWAPPTVSLCVCWKGLEGRNSTPEASSLVSQRKRLELT